MDEILWEQAVDILEHGGDLYSLCIICPPGFVFSDIYLVKAPHPVRVERCHFICDPMTYL
jgi:hypothetical protein